MFQQTSGFNHGTKDPVHVLRSLKGVVWHFEGEEQLKVRGRDIIAIKILLG